MGRTLYATVIFCLVAAMAFAGSGLQVDSLVSGLRDASGNALSGGKIYTYVAGSTTAKSLYQDKALTIPHANPLVLDNAGRAVAYASGIYKFIVKTSAGSTIFTADNLTYVNSYPVSGQTTVDPFGTQLYQSYFTASQATIFNASIASLTATTFTAATLDISAATVANASATNITANIIVATGATIYGATITQAISVPTPAVASGAANKAYVDSAVTLAGSFMASVPAYVDTGSLQFLATYTPSGRSLMQIPYTLSSLSTTSLYLHLMASSANQVMAEQFWYIEQASTTVSGNLCVISSTTIQILANATDAAMLFTYPAKAIGVR